MSANRDSSQPHLNILDSLRAVAALSVCLFHISGYFRSDPALRFFVAPAQFGWLGVQMFFVISGFVIPYALLRGCYRVSIFPRFLVKRIARIDPPYLATILIVVAFWILARRWGLDRVSAAITWPQIFAHIGYVNAFVGLPWLLESFWTLAIEFQFYVAIGLLFPLICRRGWLAAFWIGATSAALSWMIPAGAHLPHHLPLFAMGIAVFRRMSLGSSARETALLLGTATMAGTKFLGPAATAVGLGTALLVLLARYSDRYSNRVLMFVGSVSYSLYLIHPLVSDLVIVQGGKLLGHGVPASLLLLVAAVAASIAAAWLLYCSVERWSKQLSSRIRYSPSTAVPSSRQTEPRSTSESLPVATLDWRQSYTGRESTRA